MTLRVGTALAALLALGVVAGCGGGSDTSTGDTSASTAATTTPAKMENATIRLMWPAETKSSMAPLVDEFNRAQPVVTVKATYLPYAQYSTTLATQLQSGGAPDVFYSQTANSTPQAIWPLASAGKLLDMSGESWAADMDPDIKEVESKDGKTYGLPTDAGVHGIFYNVDLFDEMGLKAPQTFSDVLDMCKKIAAAGKVPISAGFADPVAAIQYTNMAMVNNVYSEQPDWTQQREQGKTTFADTPGWHRVYDDIVKMKDAGCFEDAPQGVTGSKQIASFAKGDAVMTLGGSSTVGAVQALNPKVNIDGFNLPPDEAANAMIAQLPPKSVVAYADTRYPAQVKAFFDYAAQPAQLQLVAEKGGSVSQADFVAGKVPDYLQGFVPLIKEKKYLVDPVIKWPSTKMTEALANPIAGLFTGQTSVDGILKSLDSTWDQGPAAQ